MAVLCTKVIYIGLDLLESFKNVTQVQFFEPQCTFT